LVEVDEGENLGASHVNAAALVCVFLALRCQTLVYLMLMLGIFPSQHESGFIINIFTAASSSGSELFVSRMFAPGHVPGDEDPVCGSAHSLMVPYWYKKRGIPRGQETRAKQVSRRGGDLKLVWEVDRNIVRLTGASTVLGKGELYFDLPVA
jgi:predicted PhzF superfamily epimerase YddE/YHI9